MFFVVDEVLHVRDGLRDYTFLKTLHLKPRRESRRTCTELRSSLLLESCICSSQITTREDNCDVHHFINSKTFKLLKKSGSLKMHFRTTHSFLAY